MRRVVRSATKNVQYSSPSLDAGRLLYVQTDRCAQELLLGSPSSSAKSRPRLLLRLPSTVARDPGWQPGYVQNYNSASLCGKHGPGGGGTTTLGSTALSGSLAYVGESPAGDVKHTTIVRIGLH